ncbi:MAG: DinB family protein [Chitinophagaceae bacterium]|jgi:uncharacterized damage-inducible protein DinB|nr:DinB family protein [Chitinophagaceae bacterium]
MKALRQFTIFFLVICFSSAASAQSAIDEMVKDWERAKAYTKEYLDAMPADKYSLKPTPEMRSFAGQMMHLTEGNYGIASAAAGTQSPVAFGSLEKSADMSKETVTKQVMAGYDYVIDALKKMQAARMGEEIKMFDRFVTTRGQAFAKCFEHQTHHRGQTTVYIRLAGGTPPQERLF